MGSFLQFNGLPVLAALASAVPAQRPRRARVAALFPGHAGRDPADDRPRSARRPTTGSSSPPPPRCCWRVAAHRLASVGRATRLIAPVVVGRRAADRRARLPGQCARGRRQPARGASTAAGLPDAGAATWAHGPFRVESSFVRRVAAEPGELLTDNPGLAVAAGKRITYEFQIFQLLHVEGHWSQDADPGCHPRATLHAWSR